MTVSLIVPNSKHGFVVFRVESSIFQFVIAGIIAARKFADTITVITVTISTGIRDQSPFYAYAATSDQYTAEAIRQRRKVCVLLKESRAMIAGI